MKLASQWVDWKRKGSCFHELPVLGLIQYGNEGVQCEELYDQGLGFDSN
jgi:hypothetical protein